MAILTAKQIDGISTRWHKQDWDVHEGAFARQWMTQAQEDIDALVIHIREIEVLSVDLAKKSIEVARLLGVMSDGLEGIETD